MGALSAFISANPRLAAVIAIIIIGVVFPSLVSWMAMRLISGLLPWMVLAAVIAWIIGLFPKKKGSK